MSGEQSRSGFWVRFSIGHVLILMLGIAIGFAPLRLWELAEGQQPQVLVHLQVVEVDRQELPKLGVTSSEPGSITTRDDPQALANKIDTLRQGKRAKILAEPTLVTVDGRLASFQSGGEIPVPVQTSAGAMAVEYREIGTRVDLLPKLLRNGRIRLAISPQFSELDHSQTVNVGGTAVPGIRTRNLDTELDLSDGETVILAGFSMHPAATNAGRETLVVARVERVEQLR